MRYQQRGVRLLIRAIGWTAALVSAGPALDRGLTTPERAFFVALGLLLLALTELRGVRMERAPYVTGYGIYVSLTDGRRWYVPGVSGNATLAWSGGTAPGIEAADRLNEHLAWVRRMAT